MRSIRKRATDVGKRGKLPTDIKTLARVHTETALRVLMGIMTNAEVMPAARVAAAVAILNRGWGAPSQAVELSGEVKTTYVARMPQKQTSMEQWQNNYVAPAPEMKQ